MFYVCSKGITKLNAFTITSGRQGWYGDDYLNASDIYDFAKNLPPLASPKFRLPDRKYLTRLIKSKDSNRLEEGLFLGHWFFKPDQDAAVSAVGRVVFFRKRFIDIQIEVVWIRPSSKAECQQGMEILINSLIAAYQPHRLTVDCSLLLSCNDFFVKHPYAIPSPVLIVSAMGLREQKIIRVDAINWREANAESINRLGYLKKRKGFD